MKCFRLLFDYLAWIEHQFLSGIRDSRKAVSLWGMMRGVGGVRKLIHQSWLAKGLGLGLLCWGFKGVQVEIPSEEASTLQIGSVAFPRGQCTSPQLYPCTDYLTKTGIKTVPHLPYSPDLAPCHFWLFFKLRGCRYEIIEEMKEAVTKAIDTLTQEDFHGAFQNMICLVGRVSALKSLVAGSISTEVNHGIHCWWNFRSKKPSCGSGCDAQCLPDFLVMVIQFIL